ncbi:MAG: phosphoribosylanthranilate isomerase [Sarcina sp.]
MILKICGIKTEQEVLSLNTVKCDFAGFIMTKSKRKISFETYDNLTKKLDCSIQKVAVFKNDDLGLVKNFIKNHDVDIIQLHGDEDLAYIKSLGFGKIWKALYGNNNLEKNIKKFANNVERILVDSVVSGGGKNFDWDILKNIEAKDLIVAGGINIENISELIKINEFYGIDISSGVEIDGFKNLKLMQKISSFVYKK